MIKRILVVELNSFILKKASKLLDFLLESDYFNSYIIHYRKMEKNLVFNHYSLYKLPYANKQQIIPSLLCTMLSVKVSVAF